MGNDAFSVVRLDGVALRSETALDVSLSQVPGLSLFRRNSSLSANPTTQGVSLRSIAPSGAGRSLVTLDGVPQNDPFGGWVIWSSLPPEDIAAAEIVRGAGAGPYGAGALTGVIALNEHETTGLVAADASIGELGTYHGAAAGGVQLGASSLFGSYSYQHSDGWIPVSPEQRGPADDAVTLDARSASLRYQTELGTGTVLALRGGVYDERRHSGIVGAASRAKGASGSVTLAHPVTPGEFGWRLQLWIRDTDFTNTSAAIQGGLARSSTVPANNQYATPATGYGMNAALRGSTDMIDWEVGTDMRFAQGETREQFLLVSDVFTRDRFAGGRTFVGGVYAEGASRIDGWLLTAGIRADHWKSDDGHLTQHTIATGAIFSDVDYPSRSGTLPTGRVGVRKDLSESLYIRGAAYEGFRAPSLNELYRPFRVGNNVTLMNAALEPEKLYGVEGGLGGGMGDFSWSGTLFWNRLADAITNVTIGAGPVNSDAGFVPAGGLLAQRQNAGSIDAYGFEGEAQYRVDDMLALRAAFDVVDATVDGGTTAPQLTGKRPVQAPRWTITGGFIAAPWEWLTLSAQMRYEGERFSDDQNTLKLNSAITVDARAAWNMTPNWSAYVGVDNLFDANVPTTMSADGIITYDAPRIFRIGLSYAK